MRNRIEHIARHVGVDDIDERAARDDDGKEKNAADKAPALEFFIQHRGGKQ